VVPDVVDGALTDALGDIHILVDPRGRPSALRACRTAYQ
jgi:hypothetical protein